MAKLDLSKYRDTVGKLNEAEVKKALEAKGRPMDIGLHEAIIKEVKCDDDSYIKFSSDPNWVSCNLTLENAQGQTTFFNVLIPVNSETEYRKEGSTESTHFVFAQYANFLSALGYPSLEAEVDFFNSFAIAVVATQGDILANLVGMGLNVLLSWDDRKYHPFYDSEQKCYFLQCQETFLEEPFTIDKDIKGNERWAELELHCKKNGLMFQRSPYVKVTKSATVTNDLTKLVYKEEAPAPKKVAAKVTPSVLKKPPLSPKKVQEIVEDNSEVGL